MKFRFVELADIEVLKDYPLSEEQLRFTASPIFAIERSKGVPERHPIVMEENNQIIGFFVLHSWDGPKEFSENEHAILLRSYSIHPAHQGKGVAKRSMELLPEFVEKQFPYVNEIVLTVNVENKPAQHVYKSAGFIDTGRRVMGRSGNQYVFSYLIPD